MLPTNQIFSYQDIVLDTLSEPIFVIDTNYKIVIWNKAICNLTNLLLTDVIARPIESIFSFKNIDIVSKLGEGQTIAGLLTVNQIEFRTILEPIIKDDELVGYKGGLHSVNGGMLDVLPREQLVEVINTSPMSAIIFNLDGSIMYSNNAHRTMWI